MKRFVTILGDIRTNVTPPKTRAKQIRDVLKLDLKAGDILGRGYDYYLDSYYLTGISHTGVYLGEGLMAHSVAEGCQFIDIVDFIANTDSFVILRPHYSTDKLLELSVKKAINFVNAKIQYDVYLKTNDLNMLYCHELTAEALRAGGIPVNPLNRLVGLPFLKFKRELYMYEDIEKHCDMIYNFGHETRGSR